MNKPRNPYVAGTALRGEQGFFGRQDLIRWVTRELDNPRTNCLVLFGQRRIGKTSLLLRLEHTLPDDIFLPVYFDLQDRAVQPLDKLLASLVNKVAERAGLDPNWKLSNDQGHSLISTFQTQLYQVLKGGCRPVFLLDEFDVMDQVAEVALPDTAAAKALFPFLRQVMAEDPIPAFIFAVGRRKEDLSLDYASTFKASLAREIWVLDRPSAEELVLQAKGNGTLRFTDQAIECILSLTRCHPYLTQLLCQRIWEWAYAKSPTSVPRIDVPQVETAVPDALETGYSGVSWLWKGLSSPEKIYLAALAEVAGDEKVISESRVTNILATHAARLPTREVELAPRDLVERRVLEVVGDGEYRFAVELFRLWVHQYKPLRDVKDELDREEPVADKLCALGETYCSRRDWENAIPQFRKALDRYPQHFRARLCLGESLLELGQTSEAVTELEQAYVLDKKEARNALVYALVAYAKARNEEGDEEGTLEACKRALEVSPQDPKAQQMRATVWRQRGDAAWERDDLETALNAYQIAEDAEMVSKVGAALRLRELYDQGKAHLNQKEWKDAKAVFAKLSQQDSSYKDVATQFEKAERMARLDHFLRKARHLLEGGELDDCLQQLVILHRNDPDHTYERDEATRLKEEALDQLYNRADRQLNEKQFKKSLATLGTLRKFSPTYPGLDKLEIQARAESRIQALQVEAGLGYADSQGIGVRAEDRELCTKLYGLSVKALAAGKPQQALDLWHTILKLDPHYRDDQQVVKRAEKTIAPHRMPQIGEWVFPAGAVIVVLGLLISVFMSGHWPFSYPDSSPTQTGTAPKPSLTSIQTLTPTPSPTSTPTPLPTSTPSPTSRLDNVAIAVQGTGIFAAPDADSQALGTIGEGEQVVVLARSDHRIWLYIRDDQSVEGFVYSPHLEWSGDYESLPVKASTVTTPVATSETPVFHQKRSVDEMTIFFVPAGKFLMGSDPDKDPDAQDDEQPQYKVFLSAFWIDQTEVSVAQFQRFVMETGYETEAEREGWGYAWDETEWKRVDGADWQHPQGSSSSAKSTDPVVLVSWNDAAAYCTWVGGALPTEAQWEKAARGDDGWIYPWGDRFDGNKVNFCDASCLLGWRNEDFDDGYPSLAPVGSFQNGASPYGALNMSGNVWEWVADWYSDYSLTEANPTGPETGEYKVLRGGGWYGPQTFTRAANRLESSPDSRYSYVGFRCVVPLGE